MWTEDGPKGVAKWDAIYEWAGGLKRRWFRVVDSVLDWCDDNLYVEKVKSTWLRRVLVVSAIAHGLLLVALGLSGLVGRRFEAASQ